MQNRSPLWKETFLKNRANMSLPCNITLMWNQYNHIILQCFPKKKTNGKTVQTFKTMVTKCLIAMWNNKTTSKPDKPTKQIQYKTHNLCLIYIFLDSKRTSSSGLNPMSLYQTNLKTVQLIYIPLSRSVLKSENETEYFNTNQRNTEIQI